MDEKPSIGAQAPFACLFFVVGLVYGYFLWTYSIGVTGGGHGFNAAVFALPTIVFVPALGVAWGFLRSQLAALILALMVIYAVVTDVIFFIGFDRELYERAPELFTTWYALWVGWQVPMFALLIFRVCRMGDGSQTRGDSRQTAGPGH
jgi:hypothetical protein